ncbi:MAG: (Fe-S)-binding protein [archaeon]
MEEEILKELDEKDKAKKKGKELEDTSEIILDEEPEEIYDGNTRKSEEKKEIDLEKEKEKISKVIGIVNGVQENKKPGKTEILEANNLAEEASAVFESCIGCGMCKSLCPVFKVLMEENISPRGHAILISDKVLNELVFKCNLCKACEKKCPLDIKVCEGILKARESLVLKGKGIKQNEEMIKNIRECGNPFGSGEISDLDKLYCC